MFLVWMHFKERYRASNTGRVLVSLFPTSKILIFGNFSDKEAFRREVSDAIEQEGFPPILLFPSDDSAAASAHRDTIKQWLCNRTRMSLTGKYRTEKTIENPTLLLWFPSNHS